MNKAKLHFLNLLFFMLIFSSSQVFAQTNNCLWFGGTGSWDEPANWTDCNDGVPGDDDSAVIPAGTVLVPESEQINVAEITLSGTGTVLDIDGELVVGDALEWSSGTLRGQGKMTLIAETVAEINGIFTNTLAGQLTMVNLGQILWTDGPFGVEDEVRIENHGLFDIRHDGDRNLGIFASSQSATLFNAPEGVIRKSTGTGNTTMDTVFEFDNQGLVDVLTGSLSIRTETENSGQMAAAAGALINFASQFGVSHQHAAGAIFSGEGEYRFSNGTNTFSADVEIPIARLLGSTIWTGAGAVTIADRLTWEGGTMTGNGSIVIEAEAELLLQTSSQKTLSGNRILENQGTILWNDGTFRVEDGALIDNHGLIDIRHPGNQSLGLFSSSQSATLFNTPEGVIRKSMGTGITTMDTVFEFDNQGLVDVLTGSLLIRTETENSGQMTAAAGALIDFTSQFGVSHQHTGTSSLTGAGEMRFGGGVTTIAGAYEVEGLTRIGGGTAIFSMESVSISSLILSSGALAGEANIFLEGAGQWNGGTIQGSGIIHIGAGLTLIIDGSSTKTLSGSRTLENKGTILWDDGPFNVRETARIENHGLIDIRHSGDRNLGIFASSQSATLFNAPEGVIRKSTGTGNTTMDTVFEFDNQGLVDVQSGTLLVRTNTVHSGEMSVDETAVLRFGSAFGTTHSLVPGSLFRGNGLIDLQAGIITNESTWQPGTAESPGELTISGIVNLEASSNFITRIISRMEPGIGYDRLIFSDEVQLGGTMYISVSEGFEPEARDEFSLVNCNQGCDGTFENTFITPETSELEIFYLQNAVVARVESLSGFNAPELVSPENGSLIEGLAATLQWNLIELAVSYQIQVSDDDDTFSELFEDAVTSNTFFEISDLESDKQYFWRVRSQRESGQSEWSKVWSFTTGELSPPGTLTLSVTDNNPELSWEPSSSGSVSGYNVYRGASPGTLELLAELNESSVSYTDGDVPQGGSFYAVTATGSGGSESGFTNAVSFFRVDLQAGSQWQLVSHAVSGAQADVSGSLVYGYDSVYRSEQILEQGHGYWIKDEGGAGYILAGPGATQLELDLKAGWNLVGGPTGALAVDDIVDPSAILTTTPVYGYNGTHYEQAGELMPGSGYWLFAESAGQVSMSLDLTPAAASSGKILAAALATNSNASAAAPEKDRLVVSSGGLSGELVIYGEPLTLDEKYRYLRPPLAPGQSLDVRTSEGFSAMYGPSSGLVITAAAYPVTLRLEASAQSASSYLLTGEDQSGATRQWPLGAGSEVVLTHLYERLSLQRVSPGELISETLLESGYPNPFNPSTNIRYRLAGQEQVLLEVYDLGGRRIATLVNQSQQPGAYMVPFDGSGLASGVYFVRLQAGGYTNIQKLTLIK